MAISIGSSSFNSSSFDSSLSLSSLSSTDLTSLLEKVDPSVASQLNTSNDAAQLVRDAADGNVQLGAGWEAMAS